MSENQSQSSKKSNLSDSGKHQKEKQLANQTQLVNPITEDQCQSSSRDNPSDLEKAQKGNQSSISIPSRIPGSVN